MQDPVSVANGARRERATLLAPCPSDRVMPILYLRRPEFLKHNRTKVRNDLLFRELPIAFSRFW
jgi:hypothetical protein